MTDDSDYDVPLVVLNDPKIEPRYFFVGNVARRNRDTYHHMYVKAFVLGTNNVKLTFVQVTFFKDVDERNRYKDEIEKVLNEMKLFLHKEESGVLSREGLLFVLDHV
jgi:hypothetical protein